MKRILTGNFLSLHSHKFLFLWIYKGDRYLYRNAANEEEEVPWHEIHNDYS
jgi:hypothetical protein